VAPPLSTSRTAWQLAALGLLVGAFGCKKPEPPPRRTAPWLASASATSSAATAPLTAKRSFRIDAASSHVRFSLPGRKAKPSGSVPIASGTLELSPRELQSARATIEVDLKGLSIDPSSLLETGASKAAEVDAPEPALAPNVIAQQWLELGAEVPSEKREQFARARFELSSVEGQSGPLDFASNRPARVRLTAIGSLLLHGFRAPVRAELFLQPLPSLTPGSLRLSIRSATPLVLPLAPHDIGPRNAAGIADPGEAARAEASIGKSAKIEVDLVAEAQPSTP
jgi:hypothetical protein